jgi:hypothetical protein
MLLPRKDDRAAERKAVRDNRETRCQRIRVSASVNSDPWSLGGPLGDGRWCDAPPRRAPAAEPSRRAELCALSERDLHRRQRDAQVVGLLEDDGRRRGLDRGEARARGSNRSAARRSLFQRRRQVPANHANEKGTASWFLGASEQLKLEVKEAFDVADSGDETAFENKSDALVSRDESKRPGLASRRWRVRCRLMCADGL